MKPDTSIDLLWSQGKQIEDLYNLRSKLFKLSPSERRDELLGVIESMLNSRANDLVIMTKREADELKSSAEKALLLKHPGYRKPTK
jgi:hypothetical protein